MDDQINIGRNCFSDFFPMLKIRSKCGKVASFLLRKSLPIDIDIITLTSDVWTRIINHNLSKESLDTRLNFV